MPDKLFGILGVCQVYTAYTRLQLLCFEFEFDVDKLDRQPLMPVSYIDVETSLKRCD